MCAVDWPCAGALSSFPWAGVGFCTAWCGVCAPGRCSLCGGHFRARAPGAAGAAEGTGHVSREDLAQHRSPEPLRMVAVGAHGPCHLLGRGQGLQDEHKELHVMGRDRDAGEML